MAEVIKNAVIEGVSLKIEHGFFLDSWVSLDYGGSGQHFGGFVLGGTSGTRAGDHSTGNYAAEWILGVMRAAGVEDWSKVPGRSVRVRLSEAGLGGRVLAIGHIIRDDRWFDPGVAFARITPPALLEHKPGELAWPPKTKS